MVRADATSEAALSVSNLLNPEVRANPYPFYARLREEAPVHWDPNGGAEGGWVLTRYADGMALLRDPRVTAVRLNRPALADLLPDELKRAADQVFRAIPHQLLFQDPPDHTRLRGLVNKAFTPRLVENMRPRVTALVTEMLDAAAAKGEMDVIADLAYPLPAIVIAEMLGVPPEDRTQFIHWAEDFGGLLDSSALTLEEALQALVGVSDFMDYFRGIIERRKSESRDDLLQALLAAREREDTLSEDELLANLVLLLAAGHGTTTHLIGNGLLALMRNPEQMALLREHPEFAATAVAELLRYDSPVQVTGRNVREPITLGGVEIGAGQHVTILLGAANHDPAQFADPDRLDITRHETRNMAFGFGIHFCLGAPLARLEGEVVLPAVAQRFPNLRLAPGAADALEFAPSVVFRGLRSLPVELG